MLKIWHLPIVLNRITTSVKQLFHTWLNVWKTKFLKKRRTKYTCMNYIVIALGILSIGERNEMFCQVVLFIDVFTRINKFVLLIEGYFLGMFPLYFQYFSISAPLHLPKCTLFLLLLFRYWATFCSLQNLPNGALTLLYNFHDLSVSAVSTVFIDP